MNTKNKFLIAGLSAAAIVAITVTTVALAAPKASTPQATVQVARAAVTRAATPTDADYQAWGCPMLNGNYTAVADLLGMTPQEITAQLQQGNSLVEIAATKGVTEDALVAAILDTMKQFMQQQVTAGNWTQAQLDQRLQLAEQHMRQLANAKGGTTGYGYGGYGCGGAGMTGNGMMGGWGNNQVAPNGGTLYGGGGMMGGGMMGGFGRLY